MNLDDESKWKEVLALCILFCVVSLVGPGSLLTPSNDGAHVITAIASQLYKAFEQVPGGPELLEGLDFLAKLIPSPDSRNHLETEIQVSLLACFGRDKDN